MMHDLKDRKKSGCLFDGLGGDECMIDVPFTENNCQKRCAYDLIRMFSCKEYALFFSFTRTPIA